MAKRPVFIPSEAGPQLVREEMIEFHWHPGMALSQKRKNIAALHEVAKKMGLYPILEVSTKSEKEIGVRLSAFNLTVKMANGSLIPLESAFQGSKRFERGGPFTDLYGKNGWEIKKDERLKVSGRLLGFSYEGQDWGLEPKTAFYDWLYVNSLHRHPKLRDGLQEYEGFTDIEFNPKRSVNCQARSCALYLSLVRRGIIEEVLQNPLVFLDLLRRDQSYPNRAIDKRQLVLFEMKEGGSRLTQDTKAIGQGDRSRNSAGHVIDRTEKIVP